MWVRSLKVVIHTLYIWRFILDFPGGSDSKESACNVGEPRSIPGLGRYLREGSGYKLQYSFLENAMDRGSWQATMHGVTKSRIRLSDYQSFILGG